MARRKAKDCSKHKSRILKGVCYTKNIVRGHPPKPRSNNKTQTANKGGKVKRR